jgi:hypothetical protein
MTEAKADIISHKIAAPAKHFSPHHCKISKAHTGLLFVQGFKPFMCIQLYKKKSAQTRTEVMQNHGNENVRSIGQGEARHRKYKKLKLGGGKAYDRSSD